MEANKNELYCTQCGNTAVMNEYGLFEKKDESSVIFDTPTAWYRFQNEELNKQLVKPGYYISELADVFTFTPKGAPIPSGKGRITLSMAGFHYEGILKGEDAEILVKPGLYPVFPHESQTGFEVFFNKELHRFKPENPKAVFKFVALEELIYDRICAETGHVHS